MTVTGWNNIRLVTVTRRNCIRLLTVTGWNNIRLLTVTGWNYIRLLTVTGWNYIQLVTVKGWNYIQLVTVNGWNYFRPVTVTGCNYIGLVTVEALTGWNCFGKNQRGMTCNRWQLLMDCKTCYKVNPEQQQRKNRTINPLCCRSNLWLSIWNKTNLISSHTNNIHTKIKFYLIFI